MTGRQPVHLIRLPMETRALASWADDRGWVRLRDGALSFDEGRALHHLLNEALGPGLLRPFRLLVPPKRGTGYLYAYSIRSAEELANLAQSHALPDHLAVLRTDAMQGKKMPGNWSVGQRLGFDLRVRPVRRLTKELRTANGRAYSRGTELDAFLLEALAGHRGDPHGMAKAGRTREAVYLDWLSEKLGPSAALDRSTTRLTRFQRVRAARSEGVDGPDATIQGMIDIADTAGFDALLKGGVGRHCAYGYGMLLLRPPNYTVPPS